MDSIVPPRLLVFDPLITDNRSSVDRTLLENGSMSNSRVKGKSDSPQLVIGCRSSFNVAGAGGVGQGQGARRG